MSVNHLDKIVVKGARVHNLKNVDVEIPRNSLVVFTGLSGSGKSSLAFDTIYAEGQRRFMETLSAYARQFIGGIERPDVDKIEGLVDQILAAKQRDPAADTRALETEIDRRVSALYGLTPEEIAIVEGKQ